MTWHLNGSVQPTYVHLIFFAFVESGACHPQRYALREWRCGRTIKKLLRTQYVEFSPVIYNMYSDYICMYSPRYNVAFVHLPIVNVHKYSIVLVQLSVPTNDPMFNPRIPPKNTPTSYWNHANDANTSSYSYCSSKRGTQPTQLRVRGTPTTTTPTPTTTQ
jgi:hypothetical protein